ncbi:MAG TPA: ArsI/CadI family heavy metal resistance metalloenzyme [Terriglobales bacterium]|nr:ArsI/CadI family heavy metal resistance metalloenzyme [Terriglobales bacterium]
MNPKLHISLDVKNVEESVRFYSALFAAPPTKLKPGYAKFDLDQPAINLTMQQATHCCLQGLSHMGLRVDATEEVLAVKQRLNAAGIQTLDEMNTTCCYAVQDKIWLTDPTGYRWEVYVFKGDTETAMDRPQGAVGDLLKSMCDCVTK